MNKLNICDLSSSITVCVLFQKTALYDLKQNNLYIFGLLFATNFQLIVKNIEKDLVDFEETIGKVKSKHFFYGSGLVHSTVLSSGVYIQYNIIIKEESQNRVINVSNKNNASYLKIKGKIHGY